MKARIIQLFPVFLALGFAVSASAATYFSKATGNWNDNNTWSLSSGGSAVGAGIFPVAGDAVIIERSFVVTVNITDATCANLQVGSTTQTTAATALGTLSFSASGSPALTVSGAVSVGYTGDTDRDGVITFTSGSTLTAGTLAIGGTAGSPGQGTITMTAGGTLRVGAITVNTGAGTWTPGAGTVELTANNTLPTTIFTNFNNLAVISGITTLGVGASINGALTIASGATLGTANLALTLGGNFSNTGTFNAGSSAITLSGTGNQSIDGFTTTGAVAMTKTGGTATFQGNVNGGALTINGTGGTLHLGAGLTHVFTGTWTRTSGTLNAGTGMIRFGGTSSGTGGNFTAGTSTVEWNGSGAQMIAGVAYHNLIVSGANIKTPAANITINSDFTVNSATLDLATFTANRATFGGAFTLADGATLLIGGVANFPTNYATILLGAASTVNYDSDNNQTVAAQAYGNLTFSGASTVKTLPAALNVAGNLSLSGSPTVTPVAALAVGGGLVISGGTLTIAGIDFSVGGATTLSNGSLIQNNATGSKVYNGLVTINGGTWNNSGNALISFHGGLAVSSGTFTAGAGGQTFELNNQAISGTVAIPSLIAGEVNLTNNGALTVSTALTGTGVLRQGAGATLNLGMGAASLTVASLDASADVNTVNYTGAAQTVLPTTYYHLGVSGTGNKDFGAGDVTILGNFSNSGGTMVPGTTTIFFNGGGTISGSSAKNFFNLSIGNLVSVSHTAGNLTLSGSFTNNGFFTQTAALTTTFDNTGVHFLAGNPSTFTLGNVAIQGGATVNSGTIYLDVLGNWSVTSGGVFNPGFGIVGFISTSTAQSISGSAPMQNFNDLVIEKAGQTLSIGGSTTTLNLSGRLAITGGTFAAGTATAINMEGSWQNDSSASAFSAGSGTVTFTGKGVQYVEGSQPTTFNNLVVNKTGGSVLANVNLNVTGSFSVPAGEFNAGSRNITLSGVGTPLMVAGTFTPGTSLISYSAAGAVNVASVPYHSLAVLGGNTKSLLGNLNLGGNLLISNATTLDVTVGNYAIALGGNWTNNGTFLPRNASVVFNGSGAQSLAGTVATQPFYNFIVNKPGGTLTVGGSTTTLSVTNDLTLTAGTFAAGTATTINLLGDWINDGGTFTPGTGSVNLINATAPQVIGGTASSQTFNNLSVIKAAQALSLTGGTTNLVVGNYTNTSGNFTAPVALDVAGNVTLTAGTFTAGDFITLGGNWTRAAAATFVPGSGTVTFDGGAAQTIGGTATSQTFNHLTVNKGNTLSVGGSTATLTVNNLTQTLGNFTPPATLNINGDFVHAAGTFTAGTSVNAGGDWLRNGGTFIPGTGTVTFNSTTRDQTLDGSLASQNFNNLTVNKTGRNMTVNTVTLDLSGSVTLIDGAFTAGPVMTVAGNWTRGAGASFVPGSGTVTFDGATVTQTIGGTATSQSFNDVVVAKTGTQVLAVGGSTTALTVNNLTQTSGNFTAPATLNLGGNYLHTAGNFTPGANFNVAGNWTNNAAGFTAGANVTFTGNTQAIAGTTGTTFTNLNIASPSKTRLFAVTTATLCTVSNGATLGGAANLTGPGVVNGAVSPGTSVGRWTTSRETWNGGGGYLWEINDASGTPGVGWDLLSLTTGQGINLQATAGNQFTLKLATLSGNTPGLAANFNSMLTNTWVIAITTNATVTNFTANRFVIDASAFSNSLAGGVFSVVMPNPTNLAIRFTPADPNAPVASSASFNCTPGLSVAIQITGVGGLASDPNGDPLTVSVTTPTKGDVFVIPIGSDYYLYYLNNGTKGADAFNYTVNDGNGGTATATISLTIGQPNEVSQNQLSIEALGGGQVRIRFLAIPGTAYALEATPDTLAPFTWTEMVTATADATGLIEYVVTPNGSPTFFRTRWIP